MISEAVNTRLSARSGLLFGSGGKLHKESERARYVSNTRRVRFFSPRKCQAFSYLSNRKRPLAAELVGDLGGLPDTTAAVVVHTGDRVCGGGGQSGIVERLNGQGRHAVATGGVRQRPWGKGLKKKCGEWRVGVGVVDGRARSE